MPKVVVGPKPRAKVRVIRRLKNPATAANRKLAEQTLGFEVGGKEFAILSLPAVARRINCTQARVVQLIGEGKLCAHRLGRIWIVTETDLDEFIEGRRRELKRRYQSYFEEEFPPDPQPSSQMRTRTARVVGG